MSEAHSSDDESDFKAVNSTNYQRIQEKVAKINYADGISDGREKVFQASFDLGYADGLRTGLELAKFGAFYNTLPTDGIDENLKREYAAFLELQLEKATDKQHFKYLEHQTEPLSVISEKQNIYVDKFLENCANSQHDSTILFKSQAN